MTLQQLEYIVAVDKYRHFVKAAESCEITQSTLSSLIQKLENELDAIINLINEQQRKTLEKLIDETRDNKLRKAMQKRLKNIR